MDKPGMFEIRAFYPTFIQEFVDVTLLWTFSGSSRRGPAFNDGLSIFPVYNEKNRYLTLFESLSDPAFLINEDALIENPNLAAARLLELEVTFSGMLDGSGKYEGAVVVVSDVTKQRNAPESLKIYEERLNPAARAGGICWISDSPHLLSG